MSSSVCFPRARRTSRGCPELSSISLIVFSSLEGKVASHKEKGSSVLKKADSNEKNLCSYEWEEAENVK